MAKVTANETSIQRKPGQIYQLPEICGFYLLAQVDTDHVNMINLETGNRLTDDVKSYAGSFTVSEETFKQVIGAYSAHLITSPITLEND